MPIRIWKGKPVVGAGARVIAETSLDPSSLMILCHGTVFVKRRSTFCGMTYRLDRNQPHDWRLSPMYKKMAEAVTSIQRSGR